MPGPKRPDPYGRAINDDPVLVAYCALEALTRVRRVVFRPRQGYRRCSGALGLCLVAGLMLAGCGGSPAAAPDTNASPPTSTAPPKTTTATGSPCTRQALSAAIAASPNSNLIAVNGFGCSGSWAWAGVTLGTSTANSVDAVMVLTASSGAWEVADRATSCNQHLVPAAIYNQACTTS